MKATDLRVGNYYYWNEEPECKGDVYQISDTYSLYSIDEHFFYFEPIPLTEEWLLKFGFKKIGNRYGNGHKRKVILNKQFYHSIAGYIKYVHQLQNLYFALTQTELEYDL